MPAEDCHLARFAVAPDQPGCELLVISTRDGHVLRPVLFEAPDDSRERRRGAILGSRGWVAVPGSDTSGDTWHIERRVAGWDGRVPGMRATAEVTYTGHAARIRIVGADDDPIEGHEFPIHDDPARTADQQVAQRLADADWMPVGHVQEATFTVEHLGDEYDQLDHTV